MSMIEACGASKEYADGFRVELSGETAELLMAAGLERYADEVERSPRKGAASTVAKLITEEVACGTPLLIIEGPDDFMQYVEDTLDSYASNTETVVWAGDFDLDTERVLWDLRKDRMRKGEAASSLSRTLRLERTYTRETRDFDNECARLLSGVA